MDNQFLKAFFFKALPISSLLFIGALLYLRSLSINLKPTVSLPYQSTIATIENTNSSINSEHTIIRDITQATSTIQCLHQDSALEKQVAECQGAKRIVTQPTKSQLNSQTEQFTNPNGQFIIFFIYFLQWFGLNCQLSLFFMAINKNIYVNPAYQYLADWAINAGPMLGVLGTIVSFANLLAESGTDGLAALFNSYFFNAAITTIMGGAVYVICLFLMVWIGPAYRLEL